MTTSLITGANRGSALRSPAGSRRLGIGSGSARATRNAASRQPTARRTDSCSST